MIKSLLIVRDDTERLIRFDPIPLITVKLIFNFFILPHAILLKVEKAILPGKIAHWDLVKVAWENRIVHPP